MVLGILTGKEVDMAERADVLSNVPEPLLNNQK